MNYTDICIMEGIFEKMMLAARREDSVEGILAIIEERMLFFKELKLSQVREQMNKI